MTPGIEPVVSGLIEVYGLSTLVLALAGLAMKASRQPARRLLVAKSTLVVLLLLSPIVAGARWGWPGGHREKIPTVAGDASRSIKACDCVTAAPPGRDGLSALLAGFGVGSVAMVGWLALGALASVRVHRDSREAPGRLREILDRVAGQGGRPPRLILAPKLAHPVAVGLIRPSILLPIRFVEAEPEGRIEAALTHEWAHIRNGDLWLLAGTRLLLPILFAHPLYFWLRRRIREDQEALADASAAGIDGRIAYAEALLGWARSGEGRLANRFVPSLGLWGQSSLGSRVALLLDRDFQVEPTSPRRWRLGAGVVAVVLVVGLGLAPIHDIAISGPPAIVPHVHPIEPIPTIFDPSISVMCCPVETPPPPVARSWTGGCDGG
ncbi:M56 family metallopeptidase [Tundrisphaera lichenicola]|uniref:M56 family metallopeptidase n=1 Tax=Tundrisphaera lichenicola TaxID=2029860 RepID=UPI003EBF78E9